MKSSIALIAILFSSSAYAIPKIASLFEAPVTAPEMNLNCAEFFQWMEKAQPSSVEETLKLLSEKRPKFLTKSVYAYQSRSLQGSSFANPRAIVFGGDAKTIMTFNGDSEQRGFERLEMACFNDDDNSFHFQDVAFPKEAKDQDVLADLTAVEKLQNFAHTEGRGMRDCRICHQKPERPSWDTYPFWPGFYGAVDDSNNYKVRAKMFPFYPAYGQLEDAKWRDFYDHRAGRYQYVSQEPIRANLEFGVLLQYLNGKRIVGDLKRLGEKFEAKKYQFANALFCSNEGTTYDGKWPDGKSATRDVLGEDADEITKAIFISAATSETPKLQSISLLLKSENLDGTITRGNDYDVPAIPYYLKMYPGQDFSTTTFGYVKDSYMLGAMQVIVEPLGVSIKNWSLQRFGGYAQNYALGNGQNNLRLALVSPFTKEFLKENFELSAKILELEEKETAAYNSRGESNGEQDQKAAALAKATVCQMINAKMQDH